MTRVDQKPMRLANALSIAVLLCFSSCLQMEQTVILEADGSGKLTFALTMRDATIAEVRRASAAAQLGGAVDPTAVFDKKKAEGELVDAGFVLESYETTKPAHKRKVELVATFANFAALQKNPLAGSQAEWVLAKGPKEGTAKFTFYPQGRTAWLEARAKAEKLRSNVDPVIADFFQKRRQQLAGLDIAFRIEVPGRIYLWTKTMKKTGDREATARIRAEDIKTPEDLVRRLAPRFEVIFDATGCTLPLE